MFRKYCSIENSYREKTIRMIQEAGWDQNEFCVQVKAHGSNFAVINDGEITYGKRSGPISDNFYSYECMVEREAEKLYSLCQDIGNCIVYGELLGGLYTHPEVPKYNETCIQKGVFYSPKTEFYAFDIFTDEWMNIDRVTKLFEKHGLLHAKILHRGNLESCLAYPNEFQDPISEWIGLPPIENNTVEGVVIKPIDPLYFGNGSRVILKNKNEKFAEKKQGQPKVTIDTSLSEESQQLLENILPYINENRLNNVISKIGSVTQKDFGRVAGLFTQDVLEDAEKDNIVLTVGNQQKKFLKKRINTECGNILRANFVNIIDRYYDD